MSKFAKTATLVDGRIYTLMIPNEKEPTKPVSVTFENGKPTPVTQEVYDRLLAQAVEIVTVKGREEQRHKFEFADYIDPDASSKGVRQRPAA